MKALSSRRQSAGNRDYWWYNLSSPDGWIDHETAIRLILNGKDKTDKIGKIILPIGKSVWRNRIIKASYHLYNNRKIIKVHVYKENGNDQYLIYFGRISDGIYPVTVKLEE